MRRCVSGRPAVWWSSCSLLIGFQWLSMMVAGSPENSLSGSSRCSAVRYVLHDLFNEGRIYEL